MIKSRALHPDAVTAAIREIKMTTQGKNQPNSH
jgi:hypothetical protein